MSEHPKWQWDEFKTVGTDYTDPKQVEVYDQRMREIRDVDGENHAIASLLELKPTDIAIEMGSGTGALTRALAPKCKKVIGIDVSPVMLAYAEQKAKEEKIKNISFVHSGFLTYRHRGEPAAAIVSQLALHHLPDAWKFIALKNMQHWLKPGGRLFLMDVIYDSSQPDYSSYFQRLVDATAISSREPLIHHIRAEFSTWDYLMESQLAHAGFKVENKNVRDGFLTSYLCRKIG